MLAWLAGCWFGWLAGCLTAWLLDWLAGWPAAGLPFGFITVQFGARDFKSASQAITKIKDFQHKGEFEDSVGITLVAKDIFKSIFDIEHTPKET